MKMGASRGVNKHLVYRNGIIAIIVALVVGVVFALSVGWFSGGVVEDSRPVEAAETGTSLNWSTSDPRTYKAVYIYADTSYGILSSPSSICQSTYSGGKLYNIQFTFTPASGYMWKSSSVTMVYGSATYKNSEEEGRAAAYAAASTSAIFSRSGNTFSLSCSIDMSSTEYLYSVVVVKFSVGSYLAPSYYVSYNGNGATGGSMSNSTFGVGISSSLKSNSYTRTNYTFVGWSTSSTATSATYSNGQSVSSLSTVQYATVTLYAIWKSTIKFDKQGGTGGSDTSTAVERAVMGSATAPTRSGWTFGGYYKLASGQGTQYYNSSMTSMHANDLPGHTTLYAKWTSTINLDQQTGSGGSTSVTGVYAAAMPTAAAPTKSGFNFNGYYTGTNGTGTQYYTNSMASAHVYDLAEGASLYAYWVSMPVILDQQGGAGGTDSVNPSWQAAMPSATAPTRAGWTFGGYYTHEGGIGVQYYTNSMASSKIWEESSTTTLYAKWTSKVSLSLELGSGGSTSVTIVYNAAMPSASAPTRVGYVFGGYFTDRGGEGIQYYNSIMASTHVCDLESNSILYAKWTAISYNISFEYNGATSGNGIGTKKINYGEYYNDLPVPTKTGFDFGGWYLESNFVTEITGASQMAKAEDHTLYAKWVTWLNLVITGTSSTVNVIPAINDTKTEATVYIYPNAGQYVKKVWFGTNRTQYLIEYTSATLYDMAYAISAIYSANAYNNLFNLKLAQIDPWYLEANDGLTIYIEMMSTAYGTLKYPTITSGGIEGVCVSATAGGMASILGDSYDELLDEDIITVTTKGILPNYRFVGWFFANDLNTCVSSEESAKFEKALVIKRQLVAVYEGISNNNLNMQLDNE